MSAPPGNYTVRRFSDAREFEAAASPLLMQSEATHCLQLGMIGGIEAGEWPNAFLATVDRHGTPVLVAMRTPPHNLLLSRTDDLSALQPLLPELDADVAGVLAPKEVADAFAAAWSDATEAQAELTLRQRIYRIDRVEPVVGVAGSGRAATEEDRQLLAEWMSSFLSEALPAKQADAGTTLDRWLGRSGRELRLWEVDGRPVAMAGAGSRTPNGVRISAVYTPPAERRRGYASALVAELSQLQLDDGRKFCFLFTDLTNATSNRIYTQLGYRPVADANEYRFETGTSRT